MLLYKFERYNVLGGGKILCTFIIHSLIRRKNVTGGFFIPPPLSISCQYIFIKHGPKITHRLWFVYNIWPLLQTLTICMHYIDVFTYLNICILYTLERNICLGEHSILLLTCICLRRHRAKNFIFMTFSYVHLLMVCYELIHWWADSLYVIRVVLLIY